MCYQSKHSSGFSSPCHLAFLSVFYPSLNWGIIPTCAFPQQKAVKTGNSQYHFLLTSVNSHSVCACILLFFIAFIICQKLIVIILWKDWPNRIYSGSKTSCHLFLIWHSEPYTYLGPNLFFHPYFMPLLSMSLCSVFQLFSYPLESFVHTYFISLLTFLPSSHIISHTSLLLKSLLFFKSQHKIYLPFP